MEHSLSYIQLYVDNLLLEHNLLCSCSDYDILILLPSANLISELHVNTMISFCFFFYKNVVYIYNSPTL